MKRGQGARCYGYELERGNGFVCTREEFAGNIPYDPRVKGFIHLSDRPCNCGEDHSAGYRGDFIPRREPTPAQTERKQSHLHKEPMAVYPYGDDLRKLRYKRDDGEGKYFIWQHRDDQGEWWNCSGCDHERPLYRGDWIDHHDLWRPIFIVEGEKDADALWNQKKDGLENFCATHLSATSAPDGARSWRPEFATHFTGRNVVILPDDDDDGFKYFCDVLESLLGVAATIRVLSFPGFHDVSDWIAAGHTLDELNRIAAQEPLLYPSASHEPRIQAVNVQDVVHPQPAKPCENCARLEAVEAELAMASETIKNLRRDFFRLDRVMALDSTKVTPPVKVAAYADIRHMAQARAREDRGEKGPMLHYSREALARRTGVKVDTAGRNHNKLVNLKLVKYDKHTVPMVDEKGMPVLDEKGKQLYHTTLFMAEGPLLDEVKLNEHIVAPENGWGGANRTKKACPHCGSFHVKPATHRCDDCGAISKTEDLIDREVTDDDDPGDEGEANAQDEAQDTATPLAEECDILNVHGLNSGLNHHDERADLLALIETLGYQTRIPVGIERNVGGTWVRWQTFAAQADNSLIDDALRSLRIRAQAREMAVS